MPKTRVVNLRRAQPYDIYIGRGSKWGNQYHIGIDGDRKEVIKKYRAYIWTRSDLIKCIKPELKGKRLGCFCAPLACHGDVLASLADLDPVCIIHGKKMSEHACLYCCLCFKSLMPEECNVRDDGQKEDVCKPCAAHEKMREQQIKELADA